MHGLLTYDELTDEQKETAVKKSVEIIINAINEVGSGLYPELDGDIKAATREANRMRTPWFFGHILYERSSDKLKEIATAEAKTFLYSSPETPYIVNGVIEADASIGAPTQ